MGGSCCNLDHACTEGGLNRRGVSSFGCTQLPASQGTTGQGTRVD